MLRAGPPWKGPLNVAYVESVSLLGGSTLSGNLHKEIISLLIHREFDADTNWLPELQELGIRGLLQENGYFNAVVHDGEIEVLASRPGWSSVAVTINVEEGLRYRLAGIRFAADDPQKNIQFASQDLRARFPISDGELLVVSKLRDGLEALKVLHGSNGYIDFVSEPNFEEDDNQQTIAVLIYLSLGLQYRVAQVEFRGLNAEPFRTLKHLSIPGEIFDNEKLKRFFAENQPLLRCTAPENLEVLRNIKEGTLRLIFHIQTCEQQLLRFLSCLQLRLTLLNLPQR